MHLLLVFVVVHAFVRPGEGGVKLQLWSEKAYFDFCHKLKAQKIIDVAPVVTRKVLVRSTPLATCEVMQDRHRHLSFNEWLEAMCRLCHAHSRNGNGAAEGKLPVQALEDFATKVEIQCRPKPHAM